MSKLTHLDEAGHARMVDVSDKAETSRMARATATVQLTQATMDLLIEGNLKKGDALGVARVAGIMGAKKTSELIPLCHPLPITKVTIDLDPDQASNQVLIAATVKTKGQTGVEMEALTAASVGALTLQPFSWMKSRVENPGCGNAKRYDQRQRSLRSRIGAGTPP